MRIVDLIIKKRDGEELSEQEINFLISSYVDGSMPDYQMSAFAMATFFKGMKEAEIFHFTQSLLNSGKKINLDGIDSIKVDKHSTGGVGDKTTLSLGPILASFGIAVAKMSGRGLGHTGGTLDKLEAIPNININLSTKDFLKQVKAINFAVMGQTKELVPADKKLYSLRDVTGTTMILSLIASSIMSKKLAINNDIIILDVKCGDGAFLKTLEQAQELAQLMIKIGKKSNRKVVAVITNMDQPLGNAIGNTNEVIEAMDTLQGNGPQDFTELVVTMAALVLVKCDLAKSKAEAITMVHDKINSGAPYQKFLEFVKWQNGVIDEMKFNPKYQKEIRAEQDGYMKITSSLVFGIVSMKLGSGRLKYTDKIDYNAGINLTKKTGEKVAKGDLLMTLYSDQAIKNELIAEIQQGYNIVAKTKIPKIIYEIIS